MYHRPAEPASKRAKTTELPTFEALSVLPLDQLAELVMARYPPLALAIVVLIRDTVCPAYQMSCPTPCSKAPTPLQLQVVMMFCIDSHTDTLLGSDAQAAIDLESSRIKQELQGNIAVSMTLADLTISCWSD